MRRAYLAIITVVSGQLCGCFGPVDVVESWYAAMVRGDEAAARAMLCSEVSAQIPAGALSQPGGIKRVIRNIRLQRSDDKQAEIVMLDAAGASTTIALRRDSDRWCIAGGP